MTMVLKNSAASKPESNVGATLFIQYKAKHGEGVPVIGGGGVKTAPKKYLTHEVESSEQCESRTLNSTTDARKSRERRLMAHLGLKGKTRSEFIYSAYWMTKEKSRETSDGTPRFER